jgi:hypothetical protein
MIIVGCAPFQVVMDYFGFWLGLAGFVFELVLVKAFLSLRRWPYARHTASTYRTWLPCQNPQLYLNSHILTNIDLRFVRIKKYRWLEL